MRVLGIDVGGTNVRGVAADDHGEVLSFIEGKTPRDSVDSLVSAIVEMARKLRSDAGGSVEAVGVGFPGLIDFERGVVCYSPNLPMFRDVALAGILRERLGLSVFLANDVNVAAIGEKWLGAGKELDDFALLTLGTGLGSGLIVGGLPFWGGTGFAAEMGHLVVQPDGAPCTCGDRGCLEAYCSARGLLSRALSFKSSGDKSVMWDMTDDDEGLTPQLIDLAASRGDAVAIRLLSDAARYLGIAIAALADLVGIRTVLLGGRMVNMKFDIASAAQDEANRRSICARAGRISVMRSALGDKAGSMGAARYAMACLNG